MKVYKCDSCEAIIENPHEVRMKEFYVGCCIEYDCVFPTNSTKKVKVHLCDGCYRSLKDIAIKKIKNE